MQISPDYRLQPLHIKKSFKKRSFLLMFIFLQECSLIFLISEKIFRHFKGVIFLNYP